MRALPPKLAPYMEMFHGRDVLILYVDGKDWWLFSALRGQLAANGEPSEKLARAAVMKAAFSLKNTVATQMAGKAVR